MRPGARLFGKGSHQARKTTPNQTPGKYLSTVKLPTVDSLPLLRPYPPLKESFVDVAARQTSDSTILPAIRDRVSW